MEPTPQTQLSDEEIDDLLYFARTGDLQALKSFSTEKNTTPSELLTQAIDPSTGNTLLHFCAANGHIDVLSWLLSKIPTASPILAHANNEGNTALHWAALNGHLEAVKALVAKGADMGVRNHAGRTAGFEAQRAGRGDVVGWLLGRGGGEGVCVEWDGDGDGNEGGEVQRGFEDLIASGNECER